MSIRVIHGWRYGTRHTGLHPVSYSITGARRFVVLDFGHAILLTDLVIPSCNDLASLSIDIWIQGEEVDGQRLVVSTDIGMRSLIMNDITPPPICRYLKVCIIGLGYKIYIFNHLGIGVLTIFLYRIYSHISRFAYKPTPLN